MGDEIIRPGEVRPNPRAPFLIMRDAMQTLFGESYLNKVLDVNLKAFASRGIFGWRPNDANIVMDVTPCPEPWVGDWGYRIRFCAWDAVGDIVINQFYVPSRQIPHLRSGNLGVLN